MHVFMKQDGKIFHFWGTVTSSNHVDAVWPYWNLMDFTPEGRPDIPVPPQNFRSEFLEKHCIANSRVALALVLEVRRRAQNAQTSTLLLLHVIARNKSSERETAVVIEAVGRFGL
jgi:hypothetical protein